MSEPVLIKTTTDGRQLTVVDGALFLEGELEAETLISVNRHPNARAILSLVPEARYMAGRVALTQIEAELAQTALKATETEAMVSERMRRAVNQVLRFRADE